MIKKFAELSVEGVRTKIVLSYFDCAFRLDNLNVYATILEWFILRRTVIAYNSQEKKIKGLHWIVVQKILFIHLINTESHPSILNAV